MGTSLSRVGHSRWPRLLVASAIAVALAVPASAVSAGSSSGVGTFRPAVPEVIDLVTSTTCPATVLSGSSVACTVVVVNVGGVGATEVTLFTRAPVGWTVTDSEGGGSGPNLAWLIGDLAAGASATQTITLTAGSTSGAALFTTTATGSGELNTGNNGSSATVNVVAAPVASYSINTYAHRSTVGPGELVNFSVLVSNTGGTDVDASFTDDLANVVDDASVVDDSCGVAGDGVVSECGPERVSWSGNVPVGGFATITYSVGVDDSVDPGALANSVTPGEHGVCEVCSVSVALDIPPTVDMAVSKTATSPVPANGTVTYTITASNAGPDDGQNAVVTDTLPAGFVVVSANWTGGSVPPNAVPGAVNGSTVTWAFATFPAGGTSSMTIVATAPADPQQERYTNQATVSNVVADSNTANNTATAQSVVTPQVDMEVTKSVTPEPVAAGSTVTFTISVTNLGPSTAKDVLVEDVLPPGFTYVASTSTGESPDGTTQSPVGTVKWTYLLFPPGATSVISVLATAPADPNPSGFYLNNVSVDSFTEDTNAANDTDSASSTVLPVTDLSLSKEASSPSDPTGATALPGEVITYTLTVANDGPSTSVGAVVTDILPAGFVAVAGSATPSPQCGLNGQELRCVLGSIGPGGSVEVEMQVTAPTGGGDAVNTAQVVRGLGQADPNLDDNTSNTVTTHVGPVADLSLDVAGPSAGFVDFSTDFEWTVTVDNNGPSAADDVTVVDTLPAGFTFVSATPAPTSAVPGAGGTTVVTWDLGTVLSGDSETLTMTVTAPPEAGEGTNSAQVTSTTLEPAATVGDEFDADELLVRAFLLETALESSGPSGWRAVSQVSPGDLVTYTVSAENNSAVPYNVANGLAQLSDDLSDVTDDATVVSVTADVPALVPPDVAPDASGFEWEGALAPGEVVTITVVVRIIDPPPDGASMFLVNRVIGGSSCPAGDEDGCVTAAFAVQGAPATTTSTSTTTTTTTTVPATTTTDPPSTTTTTASVTTTTTVPVGTLPESRWRRVP